MRLATSLQGEGYKPANVLIIYVGRQVGGQVGQVGRQVGRQVGWLVGWYQTIPETKPVKLKTRNKDSMI